MRAGRAIRIGLATAIAILATGAGAALAGTFNPVPGDVTIGTVGGLLYKLDPSNFNPANSSYTGEDVYCGTEASGWHETSGGGRLQGAVSAKWIESSTPFSFGDADTISDNGWSTSGYGPGVKKLTTFVICTHKHLRYLYSTVAPTGDQVRSAKLGCGGPAWHAIGGGGTIATVDSHINTSTPFDGPDPDRKPDDGWAIRVHDTVGGGLGGMSIEAICKKGPGLSYVRVKKTGLAPLHGGSARATCAPDAHVAGGGVQISGDGEQGRVASSFPADTNDPGVIPDDAWTGTAYNTAGAPKSFTVTAICLG